MYIYKLAITVTWMSYLLAVKESARDSARLYPAAENIELFENIRNRETRTREKHKRASCCLEETSNVKFL
jgi:hypothetical protein